MQTCLYTGHTGKLRLQLPVSLIGLDSVIRSDSTTFADVAHAPSTNYVARHMMSRPRNRSLGFRRDDLLFLQRDYLDDSGVLAGHSCFNKFSEA